MKIQAVELRFFLRWPGKVLGVGKGWEDFKGPSQVVLLKKNFFLNLIYLFSSTES